MKICPSSIKELRKIADIVYVCGYQGIHLEKSENRPHEYWGWWQHSGERENGITFKVNVRTQKWFCFNLASGGDVFQFIMKDLGYEYEEAVHWVAKEYKFELAYHLNP